EESTDQYTFYSLPHIFLTRSDTSSSTCRVLSHPQSSAYSMMGGTPLPQPKSSTKPSFNNKCSKEPEPCVSKKTKLSSTPSHSDPTAMHHCFSAPLTSNPSPSLTNSSPMRYRPGLVPLPSTLRPHCLARERLRKWLLAGGNTHISSASTPKTQDISKSNEQLDHILEVIGLSWA
ncbi:uncharacterized protein HD556DRAFT_1199166, partial [Suillus plorans]